ncbi:MAG: tetratricopeptide repeat protein [Acidobacteria bacterium]|nr:tetratricopeptide repeat protein [Acidobacteriota bacterium]
MVRLRIFNLCLAASAVLVALVALTCARPAYAQTPAPQVSEEVSRALSLYKSGDARGAVGLLRERVKARADDADAWHYLGLIAMKGGDFKSAVQSFQTAVKLRPDFVPSRTGLAYALLLSNNNKEAKHEAEQVLKQNERSDEAHYIVSDVALKEGDYHKALDEADAALEIQPRFKAALDVKQKALFVVYMSAVYPFQKEAQANGKNAVMALQIMTGMCCIDMNQSNIQVGDAIQSRKLAEAAAIFEKSIKRTPDFPEAAEWRETLESLTFWRDYFDPQKRAGTSKLFDVKSVTKGPTPLSKPNPQFAREEVKGFEQAKVVLRAVVDEGGEVRHVMVLRALGYELTRRAIEAARHTRFEPATKDGAHVPVITLIEYDFKELAAGGR